MRNRRFWHWSVVKTNRNLYITHGVNIESNETELLDESRGNCVSGNFRNATSSSSPLLPYLANSIASENPLQRRPTRGCEYFVKPTPVVSPAAIYIRLNQDFDGDSFDDIFSAHDLELGRNTRQGIVLVVINLDIQDNVLQSLHRWSQHVGEAELDILCVPD